MKKLIKLLWEEPVIVLAIVTGCSAVLAQQGLIPPWVTLLVLAVVTPIQRFLVTPGSKLKKILPLTRKELGI